MGIEIQSNLSKQLELAKQQALAGADTKQVVRELNSQAMDTFRNGGPVALINFDWGDGFDMNGQKPSQGHEPLAVNPGGGENPTPEPFIWIDSGAKDIVPGDVLSPIHNGVWIHRLDANGNFVHTDGENLVDGRNVQVVVRQGDMLLVQAPNGDQFGVWAPTGRSTNTSKNEAGEDVPGTGLQVMKANEAAAAQVADESAPEQSETQTSIAEVGQMDVADRAQAEKWWNRHKNREDIPQWFKDIMPQILDYLAEMSTIPIDSLTLSNGQSAIDWANTLGTDIYPHLPLTQVPQGHVIKFGDLLRNNIGFFTTRDLGDVLWGQGGYGGIDLTTNKNKITNDLGITNSNELAVAYATTLAKEIIESLFWKSYLGTGNDYSHTRLDFQGYLARQLATKHPELNSVLQNQALTTDNFVERPGI